MDRLLANANGTITIELRNAAEVLTNADPATSVTAAILDPAGTALTGSPFTATTGATGIYDVVLTPAVLTKLGVHKVTWSATLSGAVNTQVKRFDLVGDFIFSIQELRDFDADLTAAKYSTAKVVRAREWAEERFEELMGIALRPKGRQVTLDGTGREQIILPDFSPTKLVSGSIAGVALTGAEITDAKLHESGLVIRDTLGTWPSGDGNVVLYYEHGLTEAPEDWRVAAMALCRARLVGMAHFGRAESVQTEVGVLRQSIAGRDGPTGLPEVDTVVRENALRKWWA